MSQLLSQLLECRERASRGWRQHVWAEPNGGGCILGIIARVTNSSSFLYKLSSNSSCAVDLVRAIGNVLLSLPDSKSYLDPLELAERLIRYNDLPSTTLQDILALFDSAIKEEARKEEKKPVFYFVGESLSAEASSLQPA